MVVLRKLVFVFIAFFAFCNLALADNPSPSPSPAPPDGPPTYDCKDKWSQDKKDQWKLSCETGVCGAGGTGEKCLSTGKTKEGKPTCMCGKPGGGNTDSCSSRPDCSGDCKNWRGQSGKCELGAGIGTARICQCSSSALNPGNVLPAIPKIPKLFGDVTPSPAPDADLPS